ncbi:hypothetical protein [Paraburkholderia phenoliruptrix]|uniref:hypothetical protein n=1 Tax=Paraburkholderia phenoliruptrix TaxID=252970 RepID=UPI0034CD0F21
MTLFDKDLVLRDVHRLMLMLEYEANKHGARFEDLSWFNGFHEKFFKSEAAHLLISIAAAVRRIQDYEWAAQSHDERRKLLEQPTDECQAIGFFVINHRIGSSALNLRQACNKVMHAETIEWRPPANGNLQQVWSAPYYDLVSEGVKRADGKQVLMTEAIVRLTGSDSGRNWEVVVELIRFLRAAASKASQAI